MRRLFVQFYLLLMACFLVAVIMVGLVYKQASNEKGERYLSDLLRTTLERIVLAAGGDRDIVICDLPAETLAKQFSRAVAADVSERSLADETASPITRLPARAARQNHTPTAKCGLRTEMSHPVPPTTAGRESPD